MSERCEFIKPDGSRCGAWSLRGSKFCWFHDPSAADSRELAKERAGQATKRRSVKRDIVVEQTEESSDFTLLELKAFAKEKLKDGVKGSAQDVRAITGMLREIDLMEERRQNRLPAEVKVSVEFVNDWRAIPEPDEADEDPPPIPSPGSKRGPKTGLAAELASVRPTLAEVDDVDVGGDTGVPEEGDLVLGGADA